MVQSLVQDGHAYLCFCSKDSSQSREDASSEPTSVVDPCLGRSTAEAEGMKAQGLPHVIRYRPLRGAPKLKFEDQIYGKRSAAVPESFVLMKGDGYPTYHFANVVDDHSMGITHVIRGFVRIAIFTLASLGRRS